MLEPFYFIFGDFLKKKMNGCDSMHFFREIIFLANFFFLVLLWRPGTHGKGLGGNGHKRTKEEREASFVCCTRGKCRALRVPQQQELLCISFSSGLLLLSNRSCCREWRTSLVAFLVSFQLSFAFIFGL
jgi:hypothetical protein